MKINKWAKSLYYTLLWIFAGIFILQVFQSFIYNKIISSTDSILDFSSLGTLICYCFLITILSVRLIYVLSYKKEWQINYLKISFVVCVIYSLYRYDIIHHPKWQFLTLHGFDYFSILYIIPVMLLAHGLWIAKRNETEFVIGSDEPINGKELDEYGYYKYVMYLLNGVLENKDFYKNRAYNIGIIGDWGSGKTSFMNLINYAINEYKESGFYKKTIIIKFNPWFCRDKDQMQTDFLNVLQSALSPYNPEIKNSTYKYAKMLSSADINWLSKLSKCYIEKKTTSLEQSFCKLNQCIGDLNLPVMIFIDDMDRLSGEEIMAVLNLVRNTANFNNTIFVIPYDEGYLIDTIKKYTGDRPKEYLEKIINLSYLLPVISGTDKKEINSRMLVKLLNLKDSESASVTLFFKSMKDNFTLRNIKIFAQNILLANSKVKDSLYLYDLLLIEYLRLISNRLYLAVAYNINDMLSQTDNVISLNYANYLFKSQLSNGRKAEKTDEEYVKDYISPFVSKDIENKCFDILKQLFKYSGNNNNPNRLKYRPVFELYFTKVIPGDFIKTDDFNLILLAGIENYSQKLKEWRKTTNEFRLNKLIENIEFGSFENGIELMKATLVLAPQNVSELRYNSFFPKPGLNHLYGTTSINKLHRKVYRNLLEDINYDNYFDRKFILLYAIGAREIENNIYVDGNKTESNSSDLWFNYLSVYLDNKNGFEEIDFALLSGCIHIYREKRNQAKNMIRKYMRHHILSFLNSIDIKNEVKILVDFLTFTFSDTDLQGLNDLSNDWDNNFKDFLNAMPDDIRETEEFRNMYNLVK